VHADPSAFNLMAFAGQEFVKDERCATCHTTGGAANPIANTPLRKESEWLISHVQDPEVIAPGLRKPPPGGMTASQARSILSYLRRARAGGQQPAHVSHEQRTAALVYGRYCANCHMFEGEGGDQGPDLTHAGKERDAKWLREWISDPEAMDELADMPAFVDRLTEEELTAIADYLATRK
jgi:mono/diheme cytochrome c family protein